MQPATEVAVFRAEPHMQAMDGQVMSENDKRCAEAMARITKYINRACAQHLYVMRGKVKK